MQIKLIFSKSHLKISTPETIVYILNKVKANLVGGGAGVLGWSVPALRPRWLLTLRIKFLYLQSKWAQIYSASAWPWVVWHIFQVFMLNSILQPIYTDYASEAYFNLRKIVQSNLLRNHLSKSNQIGLEWSLGGPL